MFNKISRYYNLADVVTPDSNGVKQTSKSIRIIDSPDAQVEHTVDGNDRLDHIAYTYYSQSKQWWRICDANPEGKSPLNMIGKSNQLEYIVNLTYTGYQAPWHSISALVEFHPGINGFRFGYNDMNLPVRSIDQGTLQFAAPLSLQADLDEMTRRQQLLPNVQTQYSINTLAISSNLKIDKLGSGLWQIEDFTNHMVTMLRQSANPPGPDVINVYKCTITFEWNIWVRFNGDLLTTDIIDQYIESTSGFDISSSQLLNRVGKKIHIPDKYIG